MTSIGRYLRFIKALTPPAINAVTNAVIKVAAKTLPLPNGSILTLNNEDSSVFNAKTNTIARMYELMTRMNASAMPRMNVSALEVPSSDLVAASLRRKREKARVSEM